MNRLASLFRQLERMRRRVTEMLDDHPPHRCRCQLCRAVPEQVAGMGLWDALQSVECVLRVLVSTADCDRPRAKSDLARMGW